jgi:hypothetical protein
MSNSIKCGMFNCNYYFSSGDKVNVTESVMGMYANIKCPSCNQTSANIFAINGNNGISIIEEAILGRNIIHLNKSDASWIN